MPVHSYSFQPAAFSKRHDPGQACRFHTPDAAEAPFSDGKVEGVRILLADDNVDLLNMSALLFEDKGFEVLTASSGSEALDLLRQAPDIRVLLTDVVMPDINGLQLAYQARELLPHLKIILVSGYPELQGQASQDGLHDFHFLKKPYRVEDIVQRYINDQFREQ